MSIDFGLVFVDVLVKKISVMLGRSHSFLGFYQYFGEHKVFVYLFVWVDALRPW